MTAVYNYENDCWEVEEEESTLEQYIILYKEEVEDLEYNRAHIKKLINNPNIYHKKWRGEEINMYNGFIHDNKDFIKFCKNRIWNELISGEYNIKDPKKELQKIIESINV